MLSGCAPHEFDIEQLKERLPPRAAELDRLDMLAGRWETEGTVRFIGAKDPITTRGTSEAQWECDRRFLVDRSSYDMGPLGPMGGISVWGWDPQRRRYLMSWFDGFGESASGWARFDESTRTWRIETRGRSTLCHVVNHGTIRMIDDDTLEWTWTQWDAWHILKYAEMKGASRRAPGGAATSP
jgi:hypothetical protein